MEFWLALSIGDDTNKANFTFLLQVKGQIQTAVSRQLETLRSREVWLLSQVDVIESAKTGVLTQQEEQLNRALGTLHGSLEMYPKQTPLSTLDNKLSESIERYTLWQSTGG